MRITFILPVVDSSGGARVVSIYAKALADRGHDVEIVYRPAPRTPVTSVIKNVILGRPNEERNFDSRQGWIASYQSPRLTHKVLDRYRPAVAADIKDGDVVIATWWETAEWVAALPPSKGAKVYFIQHHEVFPYLPVERCHATYRLPLHKIVVAGWLRRTMHSMYGDTIIDLVPNSVDRAQFHAPERGKQARPTIGFLYAAAPSKGLDVTFRAIEIIRRILPDLQLVSFGSQQPVPNLPLPPDTFFTLTPRQQELRELYARCDTWMTASRSEGFNLPALEAMACRTPVVSTRAGWPEDAIETGHNGILVNVDDVEGLAHGALRILQLPDPEWRRISTNALQTASKGSWDESTLLFESALRRARERATLAEITDETARVQRV